MSSGNDVDSATGFVFPCDLIYFLNPHAFARTSIFVMNACILMGVPLARFEPNLGYKVDSLVPILTILLLTILSMFEILDDTRIILSDGNLV